MEMTVDLRVAELLASRLCHDLVGPIGAVGNGLELLADDEFGMADDAMQLTGNSARQASAILQFYRLAYGMAGARVGSDYSQLRDLTAALLASSKSELDWPTIQAPDGIPDGTGKLILNMVALAQEALPRGGKLAVSVAKGQGGFELQVTATGQDAHLRPECLAGLNDPVDMDELTPRGVHSYFTRIVAKRLGSTLDVATQGEDCLTFKVTLSP
ncbi:histidine phosphotransferase family protein [Pelagibius sp.]|uniref:histidine phosphotransferase family protein n=1 Tax=Pelagibius sp. TaxID=1931238 RepID=UPI0026045D9D|nr:histidine phosphotransferase family protein [Pelagibius sp.]